MPLLTIVSDQMTRNLKHVQDLHHIDCKINSFKIKVYFHVFFLILSNCYCFILLLLSWKKFSHECVFLFFYCQKSSLDMDTFDMLHSINKKYKWDDKIISSCCFRASRICADTQNLFYYDDLKYSVKKISHVSKTFHESIISGRGRMLDFLPR